jgi:hypothetical protein
MYIYMCDLDIRQKTSLKFESMLWLVLRKFERMNIRPFLRGWLAGHRGEESRVIRKKSSDSLNGYRMCQILLSNGLTANRTKKSDTSHSVVSRTSRHDRPI